MCLFPVKSVTYSWSGYIKDTDMDELRQMEEQELNTKYETSHPETGM